MSTSPPDEKKIPLDERLCFTLYSASMAVNRTFKPMLDAMGITYPQCLVLDVLDEEDGLSVGAIADRLSLESSTVTPLVKRLEQAGLLERRRSTVDERQVHVWLTDAGRIKADDSQCLLDALNLRSKMTRPELESLNRQVKTLVAALDAELQAG